MFTHRPLLTDKVSKFTREFGVECMSESGLHRIDSVKHFKSVDVERKARLLTALLIVPPKAARSTRLISDKQPVSADRSQPAQGTMRISLCITGLSGRTNNPDMQKRSSASAPGRW